MTGAGATNGAAPLVSLAALAGLPAEDVFVFGGGGGGSGEADGENAVSPRLFKRLRATAPLPFGKGDGDRWLGEGGGGDGLADGVAACAACASFFDAGELELELLRNGGRCPACQQALLAREGGEGEAGAALQLA